MTYEFVWKGKPLHFSFQLIHLGLPKEITKDGFDISFAINHLGPFLLTNRLLGNKKKRFTRLWARCHTITYTHKTSQRSHFLLWIISLWLSFSDLMKRSAPARIVTVASSNHKKGRVDFSHFYGENIKYAMDNVYNHTKLHNIICTNELGHRLQGTGTPIILFLFFPSPFCWKCNNVKFSSVTRSLIRMIIVYTVRMYSMDYTLNGHWSSIYVLGFHFYTSTVLESLVTFFVFPNWVDWQWSTAGNNLTIPIIQDHSRNMVTFHKSWMCFCCLFFIYF